MINKKHFYIQTDGNGGYNIGKGAIVMSMLIIAILGAIVPTVLAFGIMQNKINNLETQFNEEIPKNAAIMQDIKDHANDDNKDIAVVNTKLDRMSEDIKEIKADLKLLKTN